MSAPLGDRDTFLDEGIESWMTCDLCDTDLASNGVISRIRFELHACHGVYCNDCLVNHLECSNTCPIHKSVVLFHLPRKPEFVSGERNAATLDQIKDHIEASKFVNQLWHATKQLFDHEQIFDSDIKTKINKALDFIGKNYNHTYGLIIKDEHMAGVMDVAKDMVKRHFKIRERDGTDGAYEAKYWLPKMQNAMGWNNLVGSGL